METNLFWSTMVPEVLRNDNYENWSYLLKDYLLGQDLWDVITEPRIEENEAEFKTWRKKNAMALHAIKISCGTNILSEIKTKTSAKDAWDFLAKMHMPEPQEVHQPVSSTEVPGPQIDYSLKPLLEAVVSDNWDAAKSFLEQHPDAVRAQGPNGCTILHEAVIPGHLKMVKELVWYMSKQDLEIQEINGRTALYFAAAYGFTHMARRMVEKNRKLVSIASKIGHIPIVRASINGHGDMVRYLYTVTPLEELTSDKGSNGATLLSYCIVGKFFDVALNLLQNCPPLAVTLDKDGNSPVFILSRMPSAFASGSPLVFWQRCIYSCLLVHPTCDSNHVHINIQKSRQRRTDRGSVVIQVFGLLHGLLSDFLRFLGVDQIYNQKLIHVQALEILSCICEQIRLLGGVKIRESLVDKALFHAVKHGIIEFVMEITKADSNLLWITDTNIRNMFHFAVIYRQEKIFSLIYGLDASKMILKSSTDRFGNNLLHLAGMLAPSSRLDRISGAALQMQRELQWFKARRDLSTRGNASTAWAWWKRLNDNTKGYVIQAGFGSVVDLLTHDGSKSLCYCIAERWWDSTHTMHIAGRELTITPYDVFRLTGLRVIGSSIPSSYPSGEEIAQFHRRVIGTSFTSGHCHYTDVAEAFQYGPQGTTREQQIMARSFILYLIGAFLFPNSAQSMTTVWLVALEDLETCSQFAWGQAVLSYLYTSMDSLSRDQISSITGCWRLWALWARRYIDFTGDDGRPISGYDRIREFLDTAPLNKIRPRPWTGVPFTGDQAMHDAALRASLTCSILDSPISRAVYLPERVMWQLSDEVLAWQRVPMLPPSFMIYPYNISEEDLGVWQAGIPCDARFLPDGDYDVFAAEFLMPRLLGPQVAPPADEGADEGINPVLPGWRVTEWSPAGYFIENEIPRRDNVLGYPMAPGTRRLNMAESADMIQLVGSLKAMVTDYSMRLHGGPMAPGGPPGGPPGGGGDEASSAQQGGSSSHAPSVRSRSTRGRGRRGGPF